MNRSISLVVRAALLLAGGVATVPAQTPPPPPQSTLSSSRMMTPNFRDLPIEQVAEAVGEVTGVTFIVAPNVRANVSLINPTAMSATQLYYTFLSMLQVHGFAAQRSGQIVKIVQEANVRTAANDPSPLGGGPDDIVTEVIEAKNINAVALTTVTVRVADVMLPQIFVITQEYTPATAALYEAVVAPEMLPPFNFHW